MATFEDLKQRLRETAEVIGDVSADLYKRAEGKTKILAKKAKLQAENAADRTAVKRLYQQIGKDYYESHRLYPEPELEQSCAEVTVALERIKSREAEIADLRAASGEAAEGTSEEGTAADGTSYEDAPYEDVSETPDEEATDEAAPEDTSGEA